MGENASASAADINPCRYNSPDDLCPVYVHLRWFGYLLLHIRLLYALQPANFTSAKSVFGMLRSCDPMSVPLYQCIPPLHLL